MLDKAAKAAYCDRIGVGIGVLFPEGFAELSREERILQQDNVREVPVSRNTPRAAHSTVTAPTAHNSACGTIFKGWDGNQESNSDALERLDEVLKKIGGALSEAKGMITIMNGDLSALIEKFDNEKIKGLTDLEQLQVFNALKYLEIYQKIGTIAELMDLKSNERELR